MRQPFEGLAAGQRWRLEAAAAAVLLPAAVEPHFWHGIQPRGAAQGEIAGAPETLDMRM